MFAPYATSRTSGSDHTNMSGSLPGLALVPACVGMAVAWTWVVATLFVGQELAMHDTSQSCMLGGAAAALAVFAMLDLAGTRGPELNRRLMRVLSCLVAGLIVVDIYLPGNPSLPAPLIAGAWMLLGVFGAYAIRRSFHLLASLATRLSGRSILRVACACLAGAAVLSLMASNMQVREAAVVMVASVPAALWLLPQGRLMLGRKRRGTDTRTGNDGAGAPPTSVGGAKNPSAQAHSCSDLRLRQLAPYAFTFIAMGFTCGFHTSVGRVLYLDYEHFSLVFFQYSPLAFCVPAWRSVPVSPGSPSPPSRCKYRLHVPVWRSFRSCSSPIDPTTPCGNSSKTRWLS